MASNPERDRLDEMAARIRQAEAGAEPESAAPLEIESAGTARTGRIGFDFVATVLACGAIGWFADWKIGSSPWGLLAMLLTGFVVGIFNVYRALGGYDQGIGWHKKGKE